MNKRNNLMDNNLSFVQYLEIENQFLDDKFSVSCYIRIIL